MLVDDKIISYIVFQKWTLNKIQQIILVVKEYCKLHELVKLHSLLKEYNGLYKVVE